MYRKAQLFLIEVIISLSILVILITALFSAVNFTNPTNTVDLHNRGVNAINSLEDSGDIYTYFDQANYSYYTLKEDIFDQTNITKKNVENTIMSNLPLIANFKAFTYRYNNTINTWEQIDVLKFENELPSGNDITVVEYYCPGFNGNFAEFKIQLFIWYEVLV